MAAAKGLCDKHAIKLVDRLIGNEAIDLRALAAPWITQVIGQRGAIRVNLEWTDFEDDDHTMEDAEPQRSASVGEPIRDARPLDLRHLLRCPVG